MKKILFIHLLGLLAAVPVSAKNYYVKTDGNAALSGASWGWASNDLQGVIDKAAAGDVVYVAVGTYYGGFIMKEGVNVMGGYTANSSNPTERYNLMETDDSSKQSILDGGGIQRVLTQLSPFSGATTWNGFVIQNGNPSVEFKKGSVIYSDKGDNEIIGVLYKYDPASKQGMMIGTDEVKKQWGAYEKEVPGLPVTANRNDAADDLSGAEHTQAIIGAFGNQCPDFSREDKALTGNYAAYWCDTLTAGGYSDWFLPSPGEWKEVYDANLNTLMKSLGKNLDYPYWAAAHAGNALAWAFCFGNGYFHPALKYVNHYVSAIRPFSAPEHPDGIYFAGGGAFLCRNGILENCILKNNTSPSRGGGAYVGRGAQLINCKAEGNEAPEGKEIYYETATGITGPDDDSKFRIYPNPVGAGKFLTIEVGRGDTDYQWINASSGIIIRKGILKNRDNTLLTPAQQGVYILKLQSEKKMHQSKIIIQ